MFYIGCHLSSAKGFLAMGKDAEKIGATTFQFFTRNPRGGSAKPLDHEDIAAFLKLKEELGLGTLVAHAPYTLNGCSADEKIRDFAKRTMADDLERMEAVPGNLYNFHPGSHVKQGVEVGITYIAEMLNEILKPELHTTVLLETMAGKGSEVGRSFEELREILDRVELSDKMGVCMDTCHVWDAGYDIVNDLDGVLAEFDRIVGLDRLKAVHLNDSMNVRGAGKDRHARIGEGEIGAEALVRVINHPALRDLPLEDVEIETPICKTTVKMLSGRKLAVVPILLVSFLAKVIVTLLTIRSGASGGVLQPGIALGASGGAVLGVLWMQVFHTNSIGMYALLGACALLAASQQAPLMAICLVMELADAPINLFVPIGFAVAVSAFTASRLGEPLAALRLSKSAEKKVIKANAR